MDMGCGGLRGVGGNKQLLEDEKGGGTYAALDVEELSAITALARSAKWRVSAHVGSSYPCTRASHSPPQNTSLVSTGAFNIYICFVRFANSDSDLLRNRVGMMQKMLF